jgi:large subunit ribosomal protein L18
MITTDKYKKHQRRKMRVRKKVVGTPARPRLSVCRTNRHLIAQVIDDSTGKTLAYATTAVGALKAESGRKTFANAEFAKIVGTKVAQAALAAGVTQVVFDRGGYPYHGVVRSLAEAAREAGLVF